MKLKEISICTTYKHPLSIFNRDTWCVQEQYWSYLKGFDAGAYQKIIVQVDDREALKVNDYKIDTAIAGVVIIEKYFDIEYYFGLPEIQKKQTLLNLLYDCMLYLVEKFNWQKEYFISAYNHCIDSNLEYKFKIKNKNYRSPSNRFLGYVECYWDLKRFTATGVIIDKSDKILKQEVLVDEIPYNGEFIYYSKCKWDDDYTFSLYSKEGKRWSIAMLSIV